MYAENTGNLYSTRNMGLAAALLTLRFRVIHMDCQIEGKWEKMVAYFGFENTPALQECIQRFFNGELALEPKEFLSNMRHLKSEANNLYKSPQSKIGQGY